MKINKSIWLLFAVSGCAPRFAVVPQNGAALLTSPPGPALMTAYAEQWRGSPSDLPDYVTPVAVELYNGSAQPIRVSYSDFVLRDANDFRFGAINPFLPGSVLSDEA